jgi:hypothetical protein
MFLVLVQGKLRIDAKTLRHWLAEAQLPLQSHFALHSERDGLPVLSAKEGEAHEEDRGTGAASA